jgi:hypothetical protein
MYSSETKTYLRSINLNIFDFNKKYKWFQFNFEDNKKIWHNFLLFSHLISTLYQNVIKLNFFLNNSFLVLYFSYVSITTLNKYYLLI